MLTILLEIHYLSGAMLIQNNGKDSLLYTYTDNQGSLIALTDESGNIVERYAFDPWGARRNPDQWEQKDTRTKWIINRGYTGHEHLDAFGIINMNGRVYDPQTAMFFSPDPFVQAPDNWVNYNRYGYCLNNPLIYTDPSGYMFDARSQSGYEEQFWQYMGSGFSYSQAFSFSQSSGGSGGGGGGSSSSGHYEEVSTTYVSQYSYSINSVTGEFENFYAEFDTNYTQKWVYDSTEDRMYAAVHPGDDNSFKGGLNNVSNAVGIVTSSAEVFTKANPGTFIVTTINGTQIAMTTDQLIVGLEVASRNTVYLGIFIESVLAVDGYPDAQNNLGNDTAVFLELSFISAVGCGIPALVLGVGWVMYRNHAFDGLFQQQYYQNNYTPNRYTPQDAIPQYPLKDGPQPIYFSH